RSTRSMDVHRSPISCRKTRDTTSSPRLHRDSSRTRGTCSTLARRRRRSVSKHQLPCGSHLKPRNSECMCKRFVDKSLHATTRFVWTTTEVTWVLDDSWPRKMYRA